MPVAELKVAVSALDVAVAVPAADCTSCGPAEGALTVRATVVVWTALDPVALTTMFEFPGGVVPAVVIVIVEFCPAVIVAGLTVAVVPEGSPVSVSARLWALPLVMAVLIVVVAA